VSTAQGAQHREHSTAHSHTNYTRSLTLDTVSPKPCVHR
jgi:hypothetical protein